MIKLKAALYTSILFICFCGLSWQLIEKATETKSYTCVVKDKLQTAGGYKASGKFYLVLQDSATGKVFDITTSASGYSQAVVGQSYTWQFQPQVVEGRGAADGFLSTGIIVSLLVSVILAFAVMFLVGDYVMEKYVMEKYGVN